MVDIKFIHILGISVYNMCNMEVVKMRKETKRYAKLEQYETI